MELNRTQYRTILQVSKKYGTTDNNITETKVEVPVDSSHSVGSSFVVDEVLNEIEDIGFCSSDQDFNCGRFRLISM